MDSAARIVWRSTWRTPLALSASVRPACRALSCSTAAREPGTQEKDHLAQAAAEGKAPVSWNEYLRLRKQRRVAGLVTTWPTTLVAGLGSGAYLATNELPFAIAGVDPMIISVVGVLVGTGVGWLAGPTFGTSIWTWINKSKANSISQKDKQFFDHIRRNRVDASMQSVQNPIPDFYGEKIGSLREYRQWLRDQNAYRRKAAHGVKQDEEAL